MSENKSEIARIRAEMEAQYQAAEAALYGLAQGTSQHEFITAKLNRVAELQSELGQLVGEEAAAKAIVEVMSKKEDKKGDQKQD